MASERSRPERMSLAEAQLIAQHAAAGRLEIDDARIAKEVGSARRRLVRAQIYGRDRTERRRFVTAVAIVGGALVIFGGGVVLTLLFPAR